MPPSLATITHGCRRKVRRSPSVIVWPIIPDSSSPWKAMYAAMSLTPSARAASSRRFPTNSGCAPQRVICTLCAPPMSSSPRRTLAESVYRLLGISTRGPACHARYGYASAVTSTPRRRAASIMTTTVSAFPHTPVVPSLMCVICTGSLPRSPMAMASRIASSERSASSRMCEMYSPPFAPAARAMVATSSVSA